MQHRRPESFLGDFVPRHYTTPKAERAIDELLARAKTTGAKKDWEALMAVTRSMLDETRAAYHAAPREQVDKAMLSHLARWHRRYGAIDDDWSLTESTGLGAGAKATIVGSGLLFPCRREAMDFLADTYRGLARDAWEAELAEKRARRVQRQH
jgi:hypothetical protein